MSIETRLAPYTVTRLAWTAFDTGTARWARRLRLFSIGRVRILEDVVF